MSALRALSADANELRGTGAARELSPKCSDKMDIDQACLKKPEMS